MTRTDRRYPTGTMPATAAEPEGARIKRDEPGLAAPVARPLPPSLNALAGKPVLARVIMPARLQSTIQRDPHAYVLDVQGAGLQPKLDNGDRIVVSPAAPLLRGRIVVLYFRNGRAMVKQLLCPPLPGLLSTTGQIGGNAKGYVQVETLTPAEIITVPLAELSAIHAVVDAMRPDECGPVTRPPAPQSEGQFVDAINALSEQWHRRSGDAAYDRATEASQRRRGFHVVQGDRS